MVVDVDLVVVDIVDIVVGSELDIGIDVVELWPVLVPLLAHLLTVLLHELAYRRHRVFIGRRYELVPLMVQLVKALDWCQCSRRCR